MLCASFNSFSSFFSLKKVFGRIQVLGINAYRTTDFFWVMRVGVVAHLSDSCVIQKSIFLKKKNFKKYANRREPPVPPPIIYVCVLRIVYDIGRYGDKLSARCVDQDPYRSLDRLLSFPFYLIVRYRCVTDALPMRYRALPMRYRCVTVRYRCVTDALPMRYRCVTVRYRCVTDALPRVTWCVTDALPMRYRCVTDATFLDNFYIVFALPIMRRALPLMKLHRSTT